MDLASLRGKRALVTGAAGFIGRRVSEVLCAQGALVTTLVRASSHVRDTSMPGVQVVVGSVADKECIEEVVNMCKPEYVFHCAGVSRTTIQGHGDEMAYVTVNTLGTMYLVNAVHAVGTTCGFVALGTLEESTEGRSNNETDVVPASLYALSKLYATKYVEYMRVMHGFPGIVLRPTIVYGPGQTGGMFIPALVEACLKRKRFDMTSGEQKKDFLYVDDLVSAMLLAVVTPHVRHAIIGVGSGKERSLRDIALWIERIVGARGCVKVGTLPYRCDERMHYQADITTVVRVLGWRPVVDLEEGLRRTVEWWKNAK